MEKHKKQYGFVVTLLELRETIPTLWRTVEEYAYSRRIDISDKSRLLFPYFRDQSTGDFNLCHFWSNFEIASLNLWRSAEYRDFFNYLDQTGNFFYERWGDAPGKYSGKTYIYRRDININI
jgi:alpha 1,2-mannosyltransferase